jgi:MFS family permease
VALPPAVRALGVVSLLTDASSEMIYPLLPTFLTTTLGARAAFVGLVEGLAEAVASMLKIVSGRVADRMPRKKPLIFGGYSLSSLARPLVALATAPAHVLAVRVVDRIGKGVRGAPRDALLADVTPAADRGRAYGFHRAMDNAGAVAGPLLAAAVLLVRSDLRLVFALAAIPAALSLAVLAFGLREEARTSPPRAGPAPSGPIGGGTRRYLAVLAVFTLGNSSDAFLLLKAQQAGVAVAALPLLWTGLHVVKAAAGTAGGALSDRLGRRVTIAAGWVVYAIAYGGLAVAREAWQVWVLFGVYGLFHALTEGPERALVADLSPAGARGLAFGLFHAVTGGLLLPASLLAGLLWERFSPATALLTGSALSLAAAGALFAIVPEPRRAATA